MNKKPNLFIVGAPKSGTTSLYYYLKQHPEVYMSPVKEPNYFAKDFQPVKYISKLNEAEYLKLFRSAGSYHIAGEASTMYLYSEYAANEIYSFNPDAKIIMILRNPVDMVYSLHRQRVLEGSEDILDFEKALEAGELRKKENTVPISSVAPKEYLLYRDIGLYYNQISRYLGLFPNDQICIVLFDDFIRDTYSVFKRICGFLTINPDCPIDFSIKNPAKKWKNESIKKLAMSPPMIKLRYFIPHSLRNSLRSLVLTTSKKIEVSEGLRKKLVSSFIEDIKKTEKLIKTDLSRWYN